MQFFRFFCFRPFIMQFLLKKSIWDFDVTRLIYKQFTRRDLKPLTFLVLSYLQPFAVVVLQNSCSSKKTTMSESLFNQPAVCYVFDKNLQYKRFLVNFVKLLRTQFFQNSSGLLLLYLWKLSVISKTLMIISQSGFPAF